MEWIKCSEQMPSEDQIVLAIAQESFSEKYQIILAYLYNDNCLMKKQKPKLIWKESCNCSGSEYDPMVIESVTHWMPLPEPPSTT